VPPAEVVSVLDVFAEKEGEERPAGVGEEVKIGR
jgi:hypothetical protein